MATTDGTVFPINGQAFYFNDVIKSSSTGNPLTGGLTTLAITLSKDGAAFAAAAGTVTETGTTGFVAVNLTAADMTAKTISYNITAANANAVYATGEIKTLDLAEFTGRASAETVKKPEHYLTDVVDHLYNKNEITRETGSYKLYQADSTTTKVSGTASDSGTVASKGKLT